MNLLLILLDSCTIVKRESEIIYEDEPLNLIQGQRGKYLLLIDGFTFSKNNVVGSTTYWCCRSRSKDMKPCNARAMSTEQPNGLYRVVISRPKHNHEATSRMLKKFERHVSRLKSEDSFGFKI